MSKDAFIYISVTITQVVRTIKRVVWYIVMLEAIPADSTNAALLDIPRRSPLMYVKRTAYTTNDVVMHLAYHSIRGDMCSFRSDMQRQPASLEFKWKQAACKVLLHKRRGYGLPVLAVATCSHAF